MQEITVCWLYGLEGETKYIENSGGKTIMKTKKDRGG
jgi:hypothetical protein